MRLQVEQSDLDSGGVTNWPLLTVRPGARLASLQVGQWFGYQQTLAVTVDNATVGELGTYLVRGDVRAPMRHAYALRPPRGRYCAYAACSTLPTVRALHLRRLLHRRFERTMRRSAR